MSEPLDRMVRRRAHNRCEYCLIPSYVSDLSFAIDHIIARQHQGETVGENLALSCPHCNYHKGPNIAGVDPATGRITRLFNPRRDRWKTHFAWDGAVLIGKTAVGRTTILVLDINQPARVEARRILVDAGLFPP